MSKLDDETLTVAQVSGILNRSTERVRKYIRDGELKATWTGNNYLVKRSDVTDFQRRRDQQRK